MDAEAHWNRIATTYDEEIFDVYKSDKFKRLTHYLDKHKGKRKTVVDFGCGNGKSFPYLTERFGKILGVDISDELLTLAAKKGFKSVTLQQGDLTKENVSLGSCDFAFCCNVIMFTDQQKNIQFLKNIQRTLKPGGKGIIILPSLDSAIFTSWRMIDLYRREGVAPEKIPAEEFHYNNQSALALFQGVIQIDGVPTKHYTESELKVIFKDAGLEITAINKVEYDWNTELESPPKWLKDPYPWDWLVECKKGS